ncbi:hypothetical protein O3U67_10705 [Brevundimonas diminuta]|uniref:hypothetical protein n=1 Tax=Brevundimonas diminuta TaxID=293 RepID=UPI0022AFE847|nr:hypothetical protein [Brevundimonas diminuta]MCZ4108551.1 hypothetical protein [Brevundimonas diminuta]
MTHDDIQAQKRIATLEHLVTVLLAHQGKKPSDLVMRYPAAFAMDREVITRADAIWHSVHGI